jgi:hypothetical protein
MSVVVAGKELHLRPIWSCSLMDKMEDSGSFDGGSSPFGITRKKEALASFILSEKLKIHHAICSLMELLFMTSLPCIRYTIMLNKAKNKASFLIKWTPYDPWNISTSIDHLLHK